jgi:MFS family permease
MNMGMIARTLLAYRLTGSASILGIIAIANGVPVLILSLFGGAIADRFQKKRILIIGQTVSALVALSIGFSLHFNYLSADIEGSWWILAVASFVQGCMMALIMPSRQSIIAEIVEQSQLMNAIALNGMARNILRLVAPALAGFLIDISSFEAVYFVMGGVNLIAVSFVIAMPLTGKHITRKSSLLTDMKGTFHYIRQEPALTQILLFVLFNVLFSMSYLFLMPIFADDILKVGATGMGILVGISGLGAIIGSLVLASLPNKKRGAILLWSGIFLGMVLAGFAFSTLWYLSLILIALVGLSQTTRMTMSNTLIQFYSSDRFRGRMMSLLSMELGIMHFGILFTSLLADAIGVQWSVGGAAMLLFLISILSLIVLPQVRKLD